jgi:hypothetical protein
MRPEILRRALSGAGSRHPASPAGSGRPRATYLKNSDIAPDWISATVVAMSASR